MKKSALAIVILLVFIAIVNTQCVKQDTVNRSIRMATTTSTENSGLLDYLLPQFTEATGIEVHYVAVGTGQALKIGRNGDADLLLVHHRASEIKFMNEGYGKDRYEFMYNDFIIVGPKNDPAGLKSSNSIKEAFTKLKDSDSPFLSRGDDSGTHKMELSLWRIVELNPAENPYANYRSTGSGMGQTLNMAAGMDGYTMTDRGTWLNFKNRANLDIVFEGDKVLFNQYSVMTVNPDKHPHAQYQSARELARWLISAVGQKTIGTYRINGEKLFIPNYQTDRQQL